MRFRTLALALALAGCLTVAAEAKQKAPHYKAPKTHKVSIKKNHGYKTNKATKFKPRKVKTAKSHTKVRKG